MKTYFTLDYTDEIDFNILAINSHAKGYKLCWRINKEMHLDFEKTKDQVIDKETQFSRYFCSTNKGDEYTIITNRSKKGFLIPEQKSVNYFLLANNKNWQEEKKEFIKKLKKNKEVLFVFELDTKKIKQIDRFIFNDKKN